MPRQPRLDAPGVLHHVMGRGIEGAEIFRNKVDRGDFLDPIEGRKFRTHDQAKDEFRGGKFSQLQVSRNYVDAITKIGGTAYEDDPKTPSRTYMKLVKDGKEIWAKIENNYDYYFLYIVEKQAMVQEVVADAKSMANDISTTGKVAFYRIYFDFNKSDVKPESDPTLKEITKLLSQNPKLKLYVVGHTDNILDLNHNMKLSQARSPRRRGSTSRPSSCST